jgi:hypothetical protein
LGIVLVLVVVLVLDAWAFRVGKDYFVPLAANAVFLTALLRFER